MYSRYDRLMPYLLAYLLNTTAARVMKEEEQIGVRDLAYCNAGYGSPDQRTCGWIIDNLPATVAVMDLDDPVLFSERTLPDGSPSNLPVKIAMGSCVLVIGTHVRSIFEDEPSLPELATWSSIIASARRLNERCLETLHIGGYDYVGQMNKIEVILYAPGSVMGGHVEMALQGKEIEASANIDAAHQPVVPVIPDPTTFREDENSGALETIEEDGSSGDIPSTSYCLSSERGPCFADGICQSKAIFNAVPFFGAVKALEVGICVQSAG
ncbi:MAG: hypothetical protein M1827_007054 [Pycnora praestabilis]|nr:MAG: hypothetical protein M1827_007054 [Pycnora praestabilis]